MRMLFSLSNMVSNKKQKGFCSLGTDENRNSVYDTDNDEELSQVLLLNIFFLFLCS